MDMADLDIGEGERRWDGKVMYIGTLLTCRMLCFFFGNSMYTALYNFSNKISVWSFRTPS